MTEVLHNLPGSGPSPHAVDVLEVRELGVDGEDSFDLQMVEFEKKIRELHANHAQLQEQKAVLEDSIVLHVCATGAKGNVHTRCFSGARVLDVGAVVLHAGANDTRLRQMEILKRDFRILVKTVRSTSPTTRIIVSGLLSTYQRGAEKFSRL